MADFGKVAAATLAVLMEHGLAIGLCGTALFLATFLLLRIRRRRLSRLCLDSGELGTVSVSPAAIREMITAICDCSIPNGRAKIAVRSNGGRLHVLVKLRIPMGRNACSIARKIQNAAASCIKSQFGIDNIYGIDVLIGGFRGPHAAAGDGTPQEEDGCSCTNVCGKETTSRLEDARLEKNAQ